MFSGFPLIKFMLEKEAQFSEITKYNTKVLATRLLFLVMLFRLAYFY
jgi:hypothetical protein